MNGIAILIALSTLGVDYSWRTSADGAVEYVLQVEPVFVQSLIDGEEIHSDVPAEVGIANRILLRIGTKEVAKSAANAQLASSMLRGPSRLGSDYPTLLWRAGKPPEETASVTFGWQPGADGDLLYYVQIDPTLLRTLAEGDEIQAIVRPDAGRVATFVAVAGTKQLPKVAAGQKPGATTLAMTTPAANNTPPLSTPPLSTPPLSTPPLSTPPLSTPPLSTPPSSSGLGTGSGFNRNRTRFNPSPEVAPTSGTEPNPANESPLYRSPATTTPPATTAPNLPDAAAPGTRPRWSVTSELPAETNPGNNSAFDSTRTNRSGLLDPPTYGNDPRANPNGQYPTPNAGPNDYRPGDRLAAVDDPNRRFDGGAANQYDPARGAAGAPYPDNNYRPGGGPEYPNQAGQNGYASQPGNVPFRERPTGYDNSQYPPQQQQQPYPDDRFASRAPSVPVGASRPMMPGEAQQSGYPIAQTPQFAPQAPAAPAPAPAPAVEVKPQAQPLSAWAFLWCLVFFSVGGNFYLGWTAAEFYSRYKLANERLRSASR